MAHGARPTSPEEDASLVPVAGWHCTHGFYRFRREIVATLSSDSMQAGRAELIRVLDPDAENAPARLQTSIVSGHKADFGILTLDPDPLKIDALHQRLLAGPLGKALEATYSFVSMTEVSEYVPTIEQYTRKLVEDGETEGSETYQAKLKAYERRAPMMRRQRLTPNLPAWPSTCFYPMNKKRQVGENWFTLPFDERNRMMNEHARSGMRFAGKVTQLVTVALGLDDWEWGVTLWAKNPQYLKDIVYKMRYDEASARYAEFGPFYTSYVTTAEQMLEHCHIG